MAGGREVWSRLLYWFCIRFCCRTEEVGGISQEKKSSVKSSHIGVIFHVFAQRVEICWQGTQRTIYFSPDD